MKQVGLPGDAYFARHEKVSADRAVGRIAEETITPYPPGIPVVLPGERLTEPVLEYLTTGVAAGMFLPDAADRKLGTMRVVAEDRPATQTEEETEVTDKHALSADTGREETPQERADRKWNDLVQEIRVTQTGVQILFGFLLTVAFQPLFHSLPETDHVLYAVTVVLGALTTCTLVAPVALHRITTGQHIKPQAVHWASLITLVALVLLLATMTCAVLLVLRTVLTNHDTALWITVGVAALYAVSWFVLPLAARIARTVREKSQS
ncbi:DUF6328 family protein [Streptomyces sp. NPDC026672]|uniref:DUF6328 family protein n=1 Tax=unclassified Streptomyces TaxID=2593676 RepID=UPI0033C6DF28